MTREISEIQFWAHQFDLQILKQCEQTLTDPFGSGITRQGLVELKEIIRLYEIPIIEQPDSYPDFPEPYSPISEPASDAEVQSDTNYQADCSSSASDTETDSQNAEDADSSLSDGETDSSTSETPGSEEEPLDARRTVATQTDYRDQARNTDCQCF